MSVFAHKSPPDILRLKQFLLAAVLLWTLLILLFLWINYKNFRAEALNIAKYEARNSIERDLLYRRWVSGHGGVYVPVSVTTPPNPYLAHIAERDIETPSGRKLTLVNPAYMTRQVYELEASLNTGRPQAHITSDKPLRATNAPDPWEHAALQRLEEGKLEEYSSLEELNGVPVLRMIRPMMTAQPCLQCHSAQGYRLGDQRGGLSVSISLTPILAAGRSDLVDATAGLATAWFCGLGGLWFAGRQLQRRIEEREKIAAERERLLIELENKNRELEGMIYTASHDLRSPLVNIHGFGQRLEKHCRQLGDELSRLQDPAHAATLHAIVTGKIPEDLGYIRSSVTKMNGLIDGLLRLSRIGRAPLEFRSVDMNALLAEVIRGMQYQLEETGSEVIAGDLPPCRGDATQLGQVLSNLLDNALKYRQEGCNLRITIDGWRENNRLYYRISDNGRGIPPECLDRICEVFYRVDPKNSPPGEGLGLTLIQRIIHRHSGDLTITSTVAQGSRFTFSLPEQPSTDSPVRGPR